MSDNQCEQSAVTQKQGCVKWFNNKAGYGFITMKDEESTSGTDIFVHHSSLNCDSDQYRYLVQGEYVSFDLVNIDDENSTHKVKADNVTGPEGGKLMCETNRRNTQRGGQNVRRFGNGPRDSRSVLPSHVPGHDWVLMKRGGKSSSGGEVSQVQENNDV